ncbi:DUF805 domain-containing protein [Novosphingobium aquimarinum]|uniref:DUF805 domain-containing protein n=1 Tax=Novosphingobium aquimarinum TaxID=2682494 RepID=UPI0012EC371E|nr:DUF805 domain-containing protein [Novosphingobium aquimarinum]
MLDYMLMPFRRYADFSGRSRRMEYWSFALLNFIVICVLMFLMFGLGGASGALSSLETGNPSAIFGSFAGGFGLLFGIYWLAVLIPSIAVTVRRLHDRDLSGWWYGGLIIASFIPFVNLLAGIGGIVLFVFLLLPGTPGPNRYGPDPKDLGAAQAFA